MAMNPETYEEFQRQLELQKKEESALKDKDSKTKVDDDGTEYEWDESKKAWFPKLSVELMLQYQSNYSSAENGQNSTTYTDPATNVTYSWDTDKNRWEPTAINNDTTNPYKYVDSKGINYLWNTDKGSWEAENTNNESKEEEDGSNAAKLNSDTPTTYTDPTSGVKYTWNAQRQLWESDSGQIMYPSSAGKDGKYTDDKTGDTYTWDSVKMQWVMDTTKRKNDKKAKKKETKRKATEPSWFEVSEEKNSNVYVQGLPPDTDLKEFESIMSKCGIIMPHPVTGQPKLKLYKDKQGNLKGDGLCCYLKKESIDLAIQLLDDTEVRGGYRIHVQKANFELKGNYDPSKKPKMLSKKEKAKIHKQQEKLLDWKLARKSDVKKSDRVLIFKNMFEPKIFEENAVLITEIRDDLRKECEKFGDVKKVIVFDRHPDGVCSVSFKDHDNANECQHAMDGRWFDQKQIKVEPWDGTTDYQIEETDKEREVRMKNWENFLVSDETGKSST